MLALVQNLARSLTLFGVSCILHIYFFFRPQKDQANAFPILFTMLEYTVPLVPLIFKEARTFSKPTILQVQVSTTSKFRLPLPPSSSTCSTFPNHGRTATLYAGPCLLFGRTLAPELMRLATGLFKCPAGIQDSSYAF